MRSYSEHTCFCLARPSLPVRSSAALHLGSARTPARQSERQLMLDRQSGLAALVWKPLAVATSLIDPLCPDGRGAVSRRRVTVQLSEQASSHDVGSLAVSISLTLESPSFLNYSYQTII